MIGSTSDSLVFPTVDDAGSWWLLLNSSVRTTSGEHHPVDHSPPSLSLSLALGLQRAVPKPHFDPSRYQCRGAAVTALVALDSGDHPTSFWRWAAQYKKKTNK